MRWPLGLAAALLAAAGAGAWDLPPPLETSHLVGRGLAAGLPPQPLRDRLYALGWSPQGAFATLEVRTAPEGPPELRLRLDDLVEDQTLWQQTWSDLADEDEVDAFWQRHQREIDPVLDRYGIRPTEFQLGVFPLILDNEFYTLALRRSPAPGSPGWITRLELVVNASGRGRKTVTDESGYWRWASVLGFVPSPFEDRVAVVLLVQPSGWGGASQPVRFKVAGLSLKAGFPKP